MSQRTGMLVNGQIHDHSCQVQNNLTSLSDGKMLKIELTAYLGRYWIFVFVWFMIDFYISDSTYFTHTSTISLAEIKPIRFRTCGISMFAFQLIRNWNIPCECEWERTCFTYRCVNAKVLQCDTLFDIGMKLPRFVYMHWKRRKISFFFF